jgi:hypothetical protein
VPSMLAPNPSQHLESHSTLQGNPLPTSKGIHFRFLQLG